MIMQAQLTDGRIVDLGKDCECLDSIHTGPCWLHSDDLWRQMNLEILDMAEKQMATARTFTEINMVHVLLRRFAELETVRLQAKGREMNRRNIDRFIT